MTSRRLLLILPIASLCAAPCTAQENPLTNGGFETLDAAGAPVDWSIMSPYTVETDDMHSGDHALRLTMPEKAGPDPGLNRAWGEGTGQRGAMLEQTKGGIRFWYKALSATPPSGIEFTVIPMNTVPREVGAGRTRWTVPAEHVGDGKWHQGAFAYDYSSHADVVWVHAGLRLRSVGVDLLVDDFEWVEEVGPVMQLSPLTIREVRGREGEACDMGLVVRNVGDAPLPEGTVRLDLPEGLAADDATHPLPAIEPQEDAEVTWRVNGRRDTEGARIVASATAGEHSAVAEEVLASELSSLRLTSDRMVVEAGREVRVRALVTNDGSAIRSAVTPELQASEGLAVSVISETGDALPGTESVVGEWAVTPEQSMPRATITASLDGLPQPSGVRLMVPAQMPQSPADEAGTQVRAVDSQAVISSGRTRLVVALQPWLGGMGSLECRTEGGWRSVAALAHLGLIADADGDHPIRYGETLTLRDGSSGDLTYRGTVEAGGALWDCVMRFTVEGDGEAIGASFTATPRSDAAITAIEGPMLYAGELRPATRQDAILPGLEWLVEGEASSNALDFRPEHPDRVRHVPHPYKVTVPAAAMRLDGDLVGLLWDVPARQPNESTLGPASVVFSTPNNLEGHTNHLMGLMLPAAGIGMPENATRAEEPISIPAGLTLELGARLLAAPGAPDALVALDHWFAQEGVPEPLPLPRGTAEEELAFSLSAYSKDLSLWNPEWGCWYSDLIVGFRPDRGPAHELLHGARALGEHDAAQAAAELAAEVLDGDEASRSYALEHKASHSALQAMRANALGRVASQHADGTWRFSGNHATEEWDDESPDYAFLGPVGASEVGLSAANATAVLQYALLTGDEQATESGLRALAAMRQFRVPRAAQVWECPVHSPDILASAQAIDAYLLGYQLTGDEGYLQDAIYWARTGLPFVYVWSTPDQPSMQGASIPIFGATSYVLSWLGVAVQWNGLAYAHSLLDLARYDDSFPWRTVAENLWVSGLYQQATEGDRRGQWPDALNYIEGRPGLHGQTPPCFKPSTLMNILAELNGWWLSKPRIYPILRGEERAALRATAEVSELRWDADALAFTVAFPAYQWGAVEIVGVTRPASVRIDGEPASETDGLASSTEPAWRYHGGMSVVEIRFPGAGAYAVEVLAVDGAEVDLVRQDIDFRFDGDVEGWAAAHDLSELVHEAGAIRTQIIGPDPYMVRGGLSVEGRAGDVLAIVLSCEITGPGSVFFATDGSGGFSPERELRFDAPEGEGPHEIRISAGDHPQWSGQTITALRIDPPGADQGLVVIDSVRLERR